MPSEQQVPEKAWLLRLLGFKRRQELRKLLELLAISLAYGSRWLAFSWERARSHRPALSEPKRLGSLPEPAFHGSNWFGARTMSVGVLP